MSWTFAQVSDSHVRPDTPAWSQVFVDHLAEIAAGGCAFVIHTGDLLDEPGVWHARAFRAMASLLTVPLYCVPGNHDVYNPPMHDVEGPWWARLEVDEERLAAYHSRFGPSWYTFDHEGTSFVALNSLILNSRLPAEREQWAWLVATLAQLAAQRSEQIVLFAHLPLFVHAPREGLDLADFRNRYLVVAPPARDRLLDLVRTSHVGTVLSGHSHVPWEVSHTWPDGFTTRFVTTGSSGPTSAMAVDHFRLPVSPDQGLGYHEHRVEAGGLRSRYRRYETAPASARWTTGPAWAACIREGAEPAALKEQAWTARDYDPPEEVWHRSDTGACSLPACADGTACYVRQAIDVEEDAAAVYLELDTERAVQIYVNGKRLYEVEALHDRPRAWHSVGGTYSLDSARLCLALNPGTGRDRARAMRKGRNVVALRFGGDAPQRVVPEPRAAATRVAYRTLEGCSQAEPAEDED